MTATVSPHAVRASLVTRREIALIDLREESAFATGHPLFAAQLDATRIEAEAPDRIPRKSTPIVLYADAERSAGDVTQAAVRFEALGYSRVRALEGGLSGWRRAGFELFEDVNSYSKAFGELVEARRETPSIGPEALASLLQSGADVAVVDARRPDEHATMCIPTSASVPGAELVLRAGAFAPRSETFVVVHCAGRTRSILGAQSLVNAGLPNRVAALRNGTIGWVLAKMKLETGSGRSVPLPDDEHTRTARERARAVAYRAGVRWIRKSELYDLRADTTRTLYAFDVRTAEEYAAGHLAGFRWAPGGQLVQETDAFAPVRGARIVLFDPLGARADMTASWLAQMAWEVYVLADGLDGPLETGAVPRRPKPTSGRYRRPYEGNDHPEAAMRAYLEWEHGLVAQLERDASHGFFVV
jgi:rhodanese-related sulfurtransferase